MLFALLGALASAVLSPADLPALTGLLAPDIIFSARERAVSNWRGQAARHLEASPGTRAALLLGRPPATVTRCVKLNNYWCIKRAGWAGEIAADTEGHVAFASAAEGADVAALLLRRYYVALGRHSALAIVSHWAPASCGAVPMVVARSAAGRLAPRGIARTLRARFLAARGRGRGRGGLRRSLVPDRLIGRDTAVPVIAVGLGEPPPGVRSGTALTALAGLPALALLGSGSSSVPSCPGDDARIRNYAIRAASGIAARPTDDLALFDAAGRPTPHLARLMGNMAAVEIGPLGAGRALVAAAVARLAAPAPLAER